MLSGPVPQNIKSAFPAPGAPGDLSATSVFLLAFIFN